MIHVRHAKERGYTRTSWLQSQHTFSFGGYTDTSWHGFSHLRVINEDWVEPGQGFGEHPHANMEILSYVLEGNLAHRDSLGTGSTICPGEIQRMSAGTGIRHSEFNPSTTERVHFLQIWIVPAQRNLPPSYEQGVLPAQNADSPLQLIASPTGPVVHIHQNVHVYQGNLEAEQSHVFQVAPGRAVWIQMLRGTLLLQAGPVLNVGDGAAVTEETQLEFRAHVGPCEWLLLDME